MTADRTGGFIAFFSGIASCPFSRTRAALAASSLRFVVALAAIALPSEALGAEKECSAAHVRAQILKRDSPEKLLERREALRACADPRCPHSVVEACSSWLREVDALVPTFLISVVDRHGVTVEGASILVDAKTQTAGRPIEADPGDHTIVVSARGAKESRRIVLRSGEQSRVTQIVLAASDEDVQAPLPTATSAPATLPRRMSASTWTAFAVGSVGLVAIGVGVGFYVGALREEAEQQDLHTRVRASSPEERESLTRKIAQKQDVIDTDVTIARVSGAGGALLVAGAVAWYLLSRPSSRASVTPIVGQRMAGIALGGAF